MKEFTAFSVPNFKCENVDPYYIFEHIDEFDIKEIALDYTYADSEFTIRFNDAEHPVTYTNSAVGEKVLSISREYYDKHRDLIDKLIIEICKKTKSNEILLSDTALIDEKKIDSITDNDSIQSVTLGNKHDIFPLDANTYSKFKENGIKSIVTNAVCPELENNFDPIISFNTQRNLVGDANYDTLTKAQSINISDTLTSSEIENLKYLNKDATVKINFSQSTRYIEIINKLKELNPERKITIIVKNKNIFDVTIFRHLNKLKNTNNLSVLVSDSKEPIDLLNYIEYEKTLVRMINPAVKLSPFERYLYAYNIVKQFKAYKESENNVNASRNLYQLLDNEYMVCAGFSNLLGDLLTKLNIESNHHSVRVETAYDGLKTDFTVIPNKVINRQTGEIREILPNPGYHSRREIHLVDPKYGIDGYFIADPTWDNNLEHDSYIHALMTHDEVIGLKRYNYINIKDVYELFFIHDIEEFYQKINMLLDKNPDKNLDFFITEIMKRLRTLDVEFFKLLINKYQIVVGPTIKLPFEKQQEILSDIGTHIISKTNNIVNGEQFRQGITAIYNLIYDTSYVDIDALVEDTMNYNKEQYDKSFPKRYKIDKDGNMSIELNESNKFSEDEHPENKMSL